MLIGIVGLERTGKDTVANYLVKNHSFIKYNMAQPIKQISEIMFGWTISEMETNKKDELDEELGIIPRDFFNAYCEYEIPKKNIPRQPNANPEDIKEAASMITKAKNPVILAGAGVGWSAKGAKILEKLAQ